MINIDEPLDSLREKLGISKEKDYDINASWRETPASLTEKLLGKENSASTRAGISKERIEAVMDNLRTLISFFRAYPDYLLDILLDPSSNFQLTPYQRILLRVMIRFRNVYATFPRGYSKSFNAIITNYLKCVLYPNSKAFVVSPGKNQSTQIVTEKITELWDIWPGLRSEIREGHGIEDSKMQTNLFILRFKSGSFFDVLACSERTRGARRTYGIIEESAKINNTILSDVIIPTMNISRRAANGREDPSDITNKGQCYITSAGDASTDAYKKMTTILLWSVFRPDESICIGGTWRIPVLYGLLNRNFVNDLKSDGAYSLESFSREYESQWTTKNSLSYFNAKEFELCQVLDEPMYDFPEAHSKNEDIILSYDVGRNNDLSSCMVFHIKKSPNSKTYTKNLVNIYSFEKMHYAEQAANIKRLIMRYHARKLIIDANGPGVGLVDFLTVRSTDPISGQVLPAIGIDRKSDTNEMYKNFYLVEEPEFNNKIWLMRATDKLNSTMHNLVSTQMATGKIRFLISDDIAKERLSRKRDWKTMTDVQRVEALKPYVLTRILKLEMMNLRRANEDTTTITLKKISSSIKKDKFSALEYGLYYIRLIESEKDEDQVPSDIHLSSKSGKNFGSRKAITRSKRNFRTGGRSYR